MKDNQIVYSNENQIYTKTDLTFHAEPGLIRRSCEATTITDLSDYTLYSSAEPCFMCSGALVWVNLGTLVYGASDIELCQVLGVDGSNCSELVFKHSPHKPIVRAGILKE